MGSSGQSPGERETWKENFRGLWKGPLKYSVKSWLALAGEEAGPGCRRDLLEGLWGILSSHPGLGTVLPPGGHMGEPLFVGRWGGYPESSSLTLRPYIAPVLPNNKSKNKTQKNRTGSKLLISKTVLGTRKYPAYSSARCFVSHQKFFRHIRNTQK